MLFSNCDQVSVGHGKLKNQTKYRIFASLIKFSAKFCSQVNCYNALSIRALQHKGIFRGLKSAKVQELFSRLNGSAHPKGRAGVRLQHVPPRWPSAQADAASLHSNKPIWLHPIVIWLNLGFDFDLPAWANESTIWLLSRWKGSKPNTTSNRPPFLAPDFNIHYYSDQKNHRNYLSFYCSLTHFTQSCSEQNHRWTSEHTESTTTTLDMKRKFY